MDRTTRQKLCLKRWIEAGGKATIVAATGFGKTRVGLNLIEAFVKRNDQCSCLVVVPTQILKDQWIDQLEERGLIDNARVEIINTTIKSDWITDLLVLDECHRYVSSQMRKVFECVNYKNILCLTGTLERLDGKEELIKFYAPVCDRITIEEAESNGWVAPHKEYLVLLDVDLTDYNKWTREFNQCFAYFDWKFDVAMNCAVNKIYARQYAKKLGLDWSQVMGVAQKWNRSMRARKDFIYNHPKKIEIAQKILSARINTKALTFSATIKQAESIGIGYTVHSKQKKKENTAIIEEFNSKEYGVLNTSKACDEGLDIQGVNLEIILHTDSSKIRKSQRLGRGVRYEEGKISEIFTLVLRNTQEVAWFNNSNTSKVITINEEQLDRVLTGEEIQTREHEKITNTKFRF